MATRYDIFDSNIWVLGLTQNHHQATRLVKDARQGSREILVDAYIFEEVFQAIDRTHQQKKHQLKTAFANIVHNSQNIVSPSQQTVSKMNLQSVRSEIYIQLIGELLDIQAKDAPIVLLARNYKSYMPTIHTNDRGFGKLTPSNYNLPWLSMNYIR